MRRVLRQDPDVILIGEMRDEETVRTALSAAETGHLVLSTVHTLDATETINRIIDFFPPHLQQQARVMLASTLKGAIAQRLVPDVTGEGRVPASEVMVVTGRVQDLILNPEETGKITEVIAEGEYYGMRTFDQSLLDLRDGGPDHRGDGAGLRLQPARLQADAGRRRPAGQRHRAARQPRRRWRDEGEAERQPDGPGRRWSCVLVAVAAFMFLKPGGGEEEEAVPTEATVAVAGTERHRHRHRGDRRAKRSKARWKGRSKRPPRKPRAARSPRSVPAPPMPAPVAAAYDAGKTVVLLVVHDGGIDDRLVAGAAAALAGYPTSPSSSSRPSRSPATRRSPLGADVQQVPALVVMRPQRLSGGVPQASVDYGFQTPQSVVQAVVDAALQGPRSDLPPGLSRR